ncbi:helix-turn-helix transcriptional regulator [Paenibacillus tarimensis]
MRADRLLMILLLLQNERKLTTSELAEKLEVSERTVVRDMEALSASGVPVYAERGRGGGWLLSEGYRTNLTGLKSDEFVSLLISSRQDLLADLGFKAHFDAAFQKLLSSSPAALRQNTELIWGKIHIDGAGWHQSKETCPCLATVQEAVLGNRKLLILYRRDEGDVERTLHPVGLVAKRSVWYLVAEIDGDFRTYRVSRIVSAVMLDETFQSPTGFNLALYWEQSTAQFKRNLPRYPAKLMTREDQLDRLGQQPYVKVLKIQAAGNGWAAAEVEFETLDSACEIVLGFGSSIEVIVSAELRTRVISEAKAIVNLYE